MSRCYSAILGCALLWVGSFSSSAATFGDFDYEVLEDNTIEIIDYNGSDAEVVIPDTIEGLTVTTIGFEAFYDCMLTSVTIPDSVTSIGDRAFSDCMSLTSVTIPDSVTSIGDEAFNWCRSLTSVTIPDSVTSIGDLAFLGCDSLSAIEVNELNPAFSSLHGVLLNKNQTSVIQCPGGHEGHFNIPSTVTSIGDFAFTWSWRIESVTIPNSVASIGDSAFLGCWLLTTVTIGSSVTSIGDSAFNSCWGLTSVTIPDSVTSIGDSAFSGCDSLSAIEVNELNPTFSSVHGVLLDKNQTTVIQSPGGYEGHYEIPDSVTSIGDSAFYYCKNLTSVTIPDSVISIGDWAFYDCTGLTSVTIPDSVISIGYSAFSSCDGLTSVTIGSSVTSLGDQAFVECLYLIDVYFKGNAPSLGENVFDEDWSSATIYYLEGTTGWGETFAGRPTAVWYLEEPEVFIDQMTLDSAGVRLWVVGPAGRTVSVQACTDVAAGEWGELGTYSLDESGAYAFTDPACADFPSRFYRAVLIE